MESNKPSDHDVPLNAVILAGGFGTRLRSVVGEFPKVIVPVNGRPFITYLFDRLVSGGVRDCVLCTGFQAERVAETLGTEWQGMRLHYSREFEPRGTAGAVREALSMITTPTTLVLNGDSYCGFDVRAFEESHCKQGASISLLLTHVDDTSRFGKVISKPNGEVVEFAEKQQGGGPGWINAGVYLIEREILAEIPAGVAVSFEREVFPSRIGRGLYCYHAQSPFLDIGTPESYAEASAFLRNLSS